MIGMFKVQYRQEVKRACIFFLFLCFYFIKIRPQLVVVADSALISKLYDQNEPHGTFLIVPFSDHYIQIHEYNFQHL